ncbi:pyruvate kinase [Citricoccus sp. SGAir0253]|uniref:pyruvate kinase n=1 Tax=Citricoccus sp. SGAir0253 TaxID=2567881 RepID=UPI0010CD62E9|nr:pyruvate kinase [Citricoccus sp. SGAir0253]QCU79347.1 pyruvate kinase [Citricoccus sp. SGAir0253]
MDPVPAASPVRADPRAPTRAELAALRERVRELVDGARAAEAAQADRIARVHPRHRASAANLVHYVWLRGRDIRDLQGRLADLGLSSLGRLESRVLPTLESIATILDCLGEAVAPGEPAGPGGPAPGSAGREAAGPGSAGPSPGRPAGPATPPADAPRPGRAVPSWADMHAGPERLERNAEHLLGPRPAERASRIMVTFPSAAADDPGLVARMLEAGMDVARINCAHDGRREWAAMITHLRRAEGLPEDGRTAATAGPGGGAAPGRCLVAMDLAGPKLRTGPIAPGPRVLKIRPQRSATGRVLRPAAVVLVALDSDGAAARPPRPPAERGAAVSVRDAAWLAGRSPGERIRCTDARGARRTLVVTGTEPDRVTCELAGTAYLTPGTVLTAEDGTASSLSGLPPRPQHLFVRAGETIVLTRSLAPARPVPGGPHRIGCTLAQVFEDARAGHRILFDDGRIGGVITAVTPDEITVHVEAAGVDGVPLKEQKGINLPDTRLGIPALTGEDVEALPFVAQHADMVSLSFVRSARDVAELLERVRGLGREDLDVVLKVETVEAFENLPQVLLEAMRWPDIGVMIARGDLAVEAGFERLAEVQEEILWLCESGHVPVIWATQVLDSLARTGLPSRAEVTDAAMAERAECVMLNKGPFVIEAIEFLSGVLGRMEGHVSKKRTLLRRLRSWDLPSDPASGEGRPRRDRLAD